MTNDLMMPKSEAQALVQQIRDRAEDLASLLAELRDRKGWKALGYDSWALCCEEEFHYSRQHANRLIGAREVRARLESTGSTIPERHIRELNCVPEDQQAEVYEEACERSGGKPTAAVVREVAREFTDVAREFIDEEDAFVSETSEDDETMDAIEDTVRDQFKGRLAVAAARLETLAEKLRG